jgi:hypothetical protein
MAKLDNIEFFNLFTLSLFDRLYSEFPSPIDIDVGELARHLIRHEQVDDETWYRRISEASDAFSFLTAEKFIVHAGAYIDAGRFQQARLTSKGLAVLGSIPESLTEKVPLISRIRKALAGGSKEAGTEAIKQLTQLVLVAAIT